MAMRFAMVTWTPAAMANDDYFALQGLTEIENAYAIQSQVIQTEADMLSFAEQPLSNEIVTKHNRVMTQYTLAKTWREEATRILEQWREIEASETHEKSTKHGET